MGARVLKVKIDLKERVISGLACGESRLPYKDTASGNSALLNAEAPTQEPVMQLSEDPVPLATPYHTRKDDYNPIIVRIDLWPRSYHIRVGA